MMMESTRIQVLKKAVTAFKSPDEKKKSMPPSEHPDLRKVRCHRASELAVRNLEDSKISARSFIVHA